MSFSAESCAPTSNTSIIGNSRKKQKIYSRNCEETYESKMQGIQDNVVANDDAKKSASSRMMEDEVMDSPDLPLRILRKAETALQGRTSQILIVIERCTDDHNYSAIIRTAEALGIQHLWLIDPQNNSQFHNDKTDAKDLGDISHNDTDDTNIVRSSGNVNKSASTIDIKHRAEHNRYAKKATEWTSIRDFRTTKECLNALREDGREIWVTDLSQQAVRLSESDLRRYYASNSKHHDININACGVIPEKMAIVFGTESVGCTQEMMEGADLRVYFPLRGFADSLNLSVATALCIQQLFHLCPSAAGNMSESERSALRKDWFTKLARQRILTSGEKKNFAKLEAKLLQAKNYGAKALRENPGVRAKVAMIPQWEEEVKQFHRDMNEKALKSIQKYLDNPPAPLTDMRRADEHRGCFVGKNTRKKNVESWKGMAATLNYGGQEGISASLFRENVEKCNEN